MPTPSDGVRRIDRTSGILLRWGVPTVLFMDSKSTGNGGMFAPVRMFCPVF